MSASLARSSRPAEAAAVVAAAVLAAGVFCGAWALLHVGPGAESQIVDTPVYQRYGDAIAAGQVPYRDFTPEYPPLALPAFALPSLAAGEGAPIDEYTRAFEWAMLACGLLAVALAALALGAVGAPPARLAGSLALVAVSPLLLGPVVLSRYDLWPAALAAGALAAFLTGRDRLGSGALGLAIAAKVYPAVLVPLAAAWVWRRRGRREALVCAGVLLGVLALAFGPFLALGPGGVLDSLGRQLSRPLQLESLAAGWLVALHHLAGLDVEMVGSHGSQNVGGLLGDVAGVVTTVVQVAVLAWLWARFARGPMERERLLRYAAAAVVAFVALGKVLSPQFLIWLVPLVPLVAGRRGLRASIVLACALLLTQLWFPSRYWDYARSFDGLVTSLVVARDLVLVALLVVLVRRERPEEA